MSDMGRSNPWREFADWVESDRPDRLVIRGVHYRRDDNPPPAVPVSPDLPNEESPNAD